MDTVVGQTLERPFFTEDLALKNEEKERKIVPSFCQSKRDHFRDSVKDNSSFLWREERANLG